MDRKASMAISRAVEYWKYLGPLPQGREKPWPHTDTILLLLRVSSELIWFLRKSSQSITQCCFISISWKCLVASSLWSLSQLPISTIYKKVSFHSDVFEPKSCCSLKQERGHPEEAKEWLVFLLPPTHLESWGVLIFGKTKQMTGYGSFWMILITAQGQEPDTPTGVSKWNCLMRSRWPWGRGGSR